MKKIISETIDGSIKNIIQLKTVDNSLEYSQMFDALEDCPPEFQQKLMDSLNSLSQTMGVSPCETFNKALCKSDENEDVKKKLYNWWRAVFEIFSKCKIPQDKMNEYNEKVDDLMAEIMKAGDAEATSEEGLVMEKAKVNEVMSYYRPDRILTPKEKKTKPKFNRGQMVYNPYGERVRIIGVRWDKFRGNVYEVLEQGGRIDELWEEKLSETKVNENYEQTTKEDEDRMLADMDFAVQHIGEIANKVKAVVNFVNPYCGAEVNESVDGPKFKEGDIVKVRNVSGMDFHGRDAPIGTVLEINPPHPDVGVYEYLIMGMSGEFFAYENELELVPERFTEEDNSTMKNETRNMVGDSEWIPVDERVGKEYSGSDDFADDVVKEDNMENELKKGDDGWTEIGQPVGEATVTVEANDVWDVLELLDNEIAHTELTDLINSHLRTEEEIMDAINELSGETISKRELNTLLSGRMATLVDYLGLDVGEYENMGNFKDSDKPTSVELEGTDWKDITEKLTAEELADSIEGWEDRSKKLVVCDASAVGSDAVNVNVLTVTDNRDEVIKMAGEYLLGNVENWQVGDASEPRKDENGQFYTELMLKPVYEEVLENNDEVKSGEVKDGEKQVTQDGETKTLVAGEEKDKKEMSDAEAAEIMGGASETDMDAADMGVSSHEVADPYKKTFCEMTIEQEIDDPWKLLNLLWGQGKENLQELLRQEDVDEDYLMQVLDDYDIHNLTNINDLFAFDFETVLDSMGFDPKAWSRNLEFKRKSDDDTGDDDSEGDDADNETVDWLKTKLEKLPDEVFNKEKK